MAVKRLFAGSFVDVSILAGLYKNIKSDFKDVIICKWVEEKNLHVTYKFLGDVESDKIDNLKYILKERLEKPCVCEIYSGRLSFFGAKEPRIMFLTLEDKTGIITELNSYCEEKLSGAGFAVEEKKFHPHVTLARIKSVDMSLFQSLNNKYRVLTDKNKTGPQTEIKLSLIESVLTPVGPIYKII